LYLFTHRYVQHNFHIRWCPCHLTVTQQLTLLEDLSSPHVFLWGSCCSIFSFLCSFLKISVLYVLWFMASDCPFDISKISLSVFHEYIKGYTWLQSNLNVSSMIASSLFMTIIWFPHTPQTLGSNLFPGKPVSV
jgi:hypothetical protein